MSNKDLNSSLIKKSIAQYADAITSKKTSSGDSDGHPKKRMGQVGVANSKKEGGVAKKGEEEEEQQQQQEQQATPEIQQKIQRILASQWDSRYL